MIFVTAPDVTSRQYEFEVVPAGMGLDGIWQVEAEFTEGVEGIIFDSGVNTFERFSPPTLMIVKSVSGPTEPGLVVTYTNDVTHTDGGIATGLILTNDMGDFVTLGVTDNGGTWTALLSLSNSYTHINEAFDDDLKYGNGFNYDPNATGICSGGGAPDPCYDPVIRRWRIELVEDMPIGGDVTQEYRAQIQ